MPVSPAATLVEALEPLRSEPARAAVLLDIDGTLAPIVRHAADAHVPEATRSLLIEIAKRYRVVGCVSGRRAATARQIVSIGTIAYVGNHGGELLRPGSTRAEVDPELAAWTERVRRFAARAYTAEHQRLRVRSEDKDAIAAFHWRGAPDEAAAAAAIEEIAQRAQRRAWRSTGGARCWRCVRPSRSTRASASPRCFRAHPPRRWPAPCTSATTRPTWTPSGAALARSRRRPDHRDLRGGELRGSAPGAGGGGRFGDRRSRRRARAAPGAAVVDARAVRRLPQDHRPAQRRRGHRAGRRHGPRRRAELGARCSRRSPSAGG